MDPRKRTLIIALAVAALAAGAFAVRTVLTERADAQNAPVAPPPPADRNDGPRLPAYVLNMAGGDIDLSSATGNDPMGPPVIADWGARLEVAVRGEVEVKHKVTVRLYWRKGNRLQRWQPGEQYGPFSTFRFRGTGEVPFGPGLGDLVVVVSPFADIPDQLHAEWLAHPPRHWQVMRQPVVWRAHGAAGH